MSKEVKTKKKTNTQQYPLVPLRDLVVFPYMIVPLFVGRPKSIRALEKAVEDNTPVFLVAQKDISVENPQFDDIYHVGCLAKIIQVLKLPDGTIKVLIEGQSRAVLEDFADNEEYFVAYTDLINDREDSNHKTENLIKAVIKQFDEYAANNKKISQEVIDFIKVNTDVSKLADLIIPHLSVSVQDKQDVLETSGINKRLEKVYGLLNSEFSSQQIEKKIKNRVKRQMEKIQKEYYLNEQLKAIQKELGEGEDGKDEFSLLEEKIHKTKFNQEVREKALAELKKLRSMNPISSESAVVRNYLDWLLDIPWNEKTKVKKDITQAEKVLDKGHYGLEEVKERILEHLAVQAKVGKVKGPILCLVGPPGVGKTSLGKSIAEATGRNFVRISLGGVRDEAEIRGHRRTYVGAMPGKIIQVMKKAKTSNPLILLDEIDKLSNDWRGDPSAALLEVLDPEQNNTFNDHYLEVDYDLSDVMFITTANSLQMSQPLLDRMEIIRISGYTEDEKVNIARNYLISKALKEHALNNKQCVIPDEVVLEIIRSYTREAGVRNLERELMKLCRKSVKKMLTDKNLKKVNIKVSDLVKYLGVKKYKYGETEQNNLVGVTNGLAWTEVGGEILLIEVVTMPGKGKVIVTGKLGDVMKESIEAATSYVKSRSESFNIDPNIFEKLDIHVHVPEGATPKDGPSAGIAMCTSIISCLTGTPVRKDIAMTGEITLRGRVLAIGGLKEKLLAAHRSGIKTVLIPEDNVKDLTEIPEKVKNEVEIIPVDHVDQVINRALTEPIMSF